MWRAMTLALETGQRQGDLLSLRWANVQERLMLLMQTKTGVRVAVVVSDAFQACLDAVPKGNVATVLTRPDGHP